MFVLLVALGFAQAPYSLRYMPVRFEKLTYLETRTRMRDGARIVDEDEVGYKALTVGGEGQREGEESWTGVRMTLSLWRERNGERWRGEGAWDEPIAYDGKGRRILVKEADVDRFVAALQYIPDEPVRVGESYRLTLSSGEARGLRWTFIGPERLEKKDALRLHGESDTGDVRGDVWLAPGSFVPLRLAASGSGESLVRVLTERALPR